MLLTVVETRRVKRMLTNIQLAYLEEDQNLQKQPSMAKEYPLLATLFKKYDLPEEIKQSFDIHGCVCMTLSIYLSIYLPLCLILLDLILSIYLSICLSISVSYPIYLTLSDLILSVYLPIYLSHLI